MKRYFYPFTLAFIALAVSSKLIGFTIWHNPASDIPTVKVRVFKSQKDFENMLKARNMSSKTVDFIVALGGQAGTILTAVAAYEDLKNTAAKEGLTESDKRQMDKLEQEITEETALKERKGQITAEQEKREKALEQKAGKTAEIKEAQEYLSVARDAVKNLKEEGVLTSLYKTITRKLFTIEHYPDVRKGTSVTLDPTKIKGTTAYIVIIEHKSDIPLWEGDIKADGTYTFTAIKQPNDVTTGVLSAGKLTEKPKVAPTEKPTQPTQPTQPTPLASAFAPNGATSGKSAGTAAGAAAKAEEKEAKATEEKTKAAGKVAKEVTTKATASR